VVECTATAARKPSFPERHRTCFSSVATHLRDAEMAGHGHGSASGVAQLVSVATFRHNLYQKNMCGSKNPSDGGGVQGKQGADARCI